MPAASAPRVFVAASTAAARSTEVESRKAARKASFKEFLDMVFSLLQFLRLARPVKFDLVNTSHRVPGFGARTIELFVGALQTQVIGALSRHVRNKIEADS
jgi:hypothetical protein